MQKPASVVGAEEEMHELESMVALLGGMTFAVILFGRHAPCVTWLLRKAQSALASTQYLHGHDPPPMYLVYGWHRVSASSSQPRPGRRCAHAWHAEEEKRQPTVILHTLHMQQRMLCFMSNTSRHPKSLKAPMMTARPQL